MAEIARGELSEQERRSHEMGMHTERLKDRSHQIFFDFDLSETSHGFALPNAFDVDFNRRAEMDASNMPSKEELIAKVMFLINSSAQRLAVSLAGVARNLAVVIDQAAKEGKFAS